MLPKSVTMGTGLNWDKNQPRHFLLQAAHHNELINTVCLQKSLPPRSLAPEKCDTYSVPCELDLKKLMCIVINGVTLQGKEDDSDCC